MAEPGSKQERILEGLQLPKEPAKEAANKVKEIIVEPVLTNDEIKAKEGTYFDEKAIKTLIEDDADVYGKDPETGDSAATLISTGPLNLVLYKFHTATDSSAETPSRILGDTSITT